MENIHQKLLEAPSFIKMMRAIVLHSSADDLGIKLIVEERNVSSGFDWGYLLLVGGILAVATSDTAKLSALRIVQCYLTQNETSEVGRVRAALILNALANEPAITLAKNKYKLKENYEDNLPLPIAMSFQRRAVALRIDDGSEAGFKANHFQKELWSTLKKNRYISVSAPTSTGKSFIFARWVAYSLKSNIENDMQGGIIYLVPTRALMTQVSRDLKNSIPQELIEKINISNEFFQADAPLQPVYFVYVLTQERLQILLLKRPTIKVVSLIVDESQNIGDRTRGTLLQTVIEQLVYLNPSMQILFASPMIANPEILYEDFGDRDISCSLRVDDKVVLQNLYWIKKKPGVRYEWSVVLKDGTGDLEIGAGFNLDQTIPNVDYLPRFAFAVAKNTIGNLIYVNSPNKAEQAAVSLCALIKADMPRTRIKSDAILEGLKDLIELSNRGVSEAFLLSQTLPYGVAFHYGPMPAVLRDEIENLFNKGHIKFLFCTSTLIEGVNLSCRNIFLYNPKKGNAPLSTDEFWNIAGRAGRWGKEFQGNIFCISAEKWKIPPPTIRHTAILRRALDGAVAESAALLDLINLGFDFDLRKTEAYLIQAFAYFAGHSDGNGGFENLLSERRLSPEKIQSLAVAVTKVTATLNVSTTVLRRNPSVSPYALEALYLAFAKKDPLEIIVPEGKPDRKVYEAIFNLLRETKLSLGLGSSAKGASFFASLVYKWSSGHSLHSIIKDQLRYEEWRSKHLLATTKSTQERSPANVIRDTLKNVDKAARFEAPKGINCYVDVLRQFAEATRNEKLLLKLTSVEDIALFLELGVSERTQVSMMQLGLSRLATVEVSRLIGQSDLTELTIRHWFTANQKRVLNADLPVLVKREVKQIFFPLVGD